MDKSEEYKGLSINKGVAQPSSLNQNIAKKFRQSGGKTLSLDELLTGILEGNRTLLGKSITLIESSLKQHQELARDLINKCLPYSGKSIRIGITGIPGVGKSTFIESLGTFLISQRGKKIAVLAVDPSSNRSKGSILGDKTRMLNLSSDENAFIRPSPSAGTLGGVAQKTRETILLCEAAGYDTIFIETVGVGQSETTVYSMVDFFLLMMLPGAGDELQGIKRGIMELADLIVINKADDHSNERISHTKQEFINALHYLAPSPSGWQPKAEACSSINNQGIEKIWEIIEEYKAFADSNEYFTSRRQEQAKFWFTETIDAEIKRSFYSDRDIANDIKVYERLVTSNQISPFVAASELLRKYFNK